jgi:hypothetical protein
MSTMAEKVHAVIVDGQIQVVFASRRDAMIYIYINEIPDETVEIQSSHYILYPTFALGGTPDEIRKRHHERVSSLPTGS